MKKALLLIAAVATTALGAQPALAKGHVAGAAIGAVVAPKHHRVAGAVVGGAVGHHMAKAKEKKQAAAGQN
ncbi:MAG: hypothetical protein ABIO39_06310 [Caulobacteraceae bacterium]